MWTDGRNRSVRKAVTFTPAEWERVEHRLRRAGSVFPVSWNAYARAMMLKGKYVAIEVPFDFPRLTAPINRIGSNINQIARKCNEDDRATVEELRQVKRELEECRRLLGDAWELLCDAKTLVKEGKGRTYPAIPASEDSEDGDL